MLEERVFAKIGMGRGTENWGRSLENHSITKCAVGATIGPLSIETPCLQAYSNVDIYCLALSLRDYSPHELLLFSSAKVARSVNGNGIIAISPAITNLLSLIRGHCPWNAPWFLTANELITNLQHLKADSPRQVAWDQKNRRRQAVRFFYEVPPKSALFLDDASLGGSIVSALPFH